MIARGLLNKRATITSRTKVSDGAGGLTETLTTRYSNVPCRMSSPSGTRQLLYAAQKAPINWTMYTDYKADVLTTDLVTVDGVTYEILFIKNPSMVGHHMEIDLRTVTL